MIIITPTGIRVTLPDAVDFNTRDSIQYFKDDNGKILGYYYKETGQFIIVGGVNCEVERIKDAD